MWSLPQRGQNRFADRLIVCITKVPWPATPTFYFACSPKLTRPKSLLHQTENNFRGPQKQKNLSIVGIAMRNLSHHFLPGMEARARSENRRGVHSRLGGLRKAKIYTSLWPTYNCQN